MIAEIPLDIELPLETPGIIAENPEINCENPEINCENPEELLPELIQEPEIQKRPRGRPKGSAKPKAAAPPPKAVAPPPKAAKQKAKARPRKEQVRYESSSDEDLPEYVRQEVAPQRDLATQMLKLLQGHESIRTARKRQLYSSWFAHH